VAWFKLDDSAYDHPKVAGLSDGAFRLWVTCGLYCSKHLTDGIVTAVTLRVLQAKGKHCDELWTAGLWERVPEGGYRFHDWTDYQWTRRQVEQKRQHDRERKAQWRDAKAQKTSRAGDEPPDEPW
jgi:hypothetical protein